jgi:DNA-binding CsgD family transcriptional regulator
MIDGMSPGEWPVTRGDWPLVGRDEELAYVRRARRGDAPAVVVGGVQGVGRSRLVAEALAAARAERSATEQVDGTAATASIPFGAVAHLAPPGTSGGDALGLLLATTDHLRARASRRPLIIAVDDAHQLDEASLALIRRLVGTPSLFLLLTIRSDEPVPAPIVALWKDGHARRLELQPLSRHETYALVAQATSGAPGPDAARRLWDHSLGNPLFLRELVLSGERGEGGHAGAAVPGAAAGPGPRLAELVRSRLGRLDDDQRTALETVVVGGPLPSDLLDSVVPDTTVASLVDRGLLVERDDGPVATVALAHPVYGVVLGASLTSSRARRLRSVLLDQLERSGAGSPSAAVRLATLRLDQGVDLDAQQLVVASRYAHAAFPHALAERVPADLAHIDEIDAAVARTEPAARPSPDDLAVAERLARAGWNADRSLGAGLALTAILVAQGGGDDATAVLSELDARAGSGADRVPVALARAALEFWVLGQADQALATLKAADDATTDTAERSRLRRLRAGIALNVGRVDEAADLATDLVEAGDQPPPLAAMAAATAAAALAIAGRVAESVAMVDRYLPVALAHADEISEVVGQLLLARLFAARVLGDTDEAEALGYACHQPAAEQGSLAGMAVFTASLGQIALDRGRLGTAARRLREADVLLGEYDTFGYRPWVLASLAMAHAQAGDAERARTAYDRARATTTQPRYFDSDLVLADAWCRAADGRIDDAAATAAEAAAQARRHGLAPFEAAALHTLVRFGRPQPAAERLGALAASTGSPLVSLYARHAAAATADDGDELDQVAAAFAGLGAHLLAAEASAQAGAAHQRAGRAALGRRSLARSHPPVDAGPAARTPALLQAAEAPGLTAREREVAALAGQGLTSKAIAERLVLSPRTVESHLYRIFAKLGVADRGELAAAISGSAPAPHP